ncbi:hypothetical protein ACRALDRAFT_1064809, partial [Sodiomyces alcalophilus JCM 7366]|uniref:uncharacterized protein n=1 Tax=Sodiomyces alcalophilus JCM 7366 TaxID=591952 RepID=UPI0039B4F60B
MVVFRATSGLYERLKGPLNLSQVLPSEASAVLWVAVFMVEEEEECSPVGHPN